MSQLNTNYAAATTARVELKTTPEVKQLLEQAAIASGLTLTAFVIAHAQAHANQIMNEVNTVRLNQAAWNILDDAIANPAPATDALKALMQRKR